MQRLEFNCRHVWPDGFRLEASFVANEGVTALVGTSGSGKTTALQLIAGLRRPDAGRIALDGTVLVDVAAGIFLPPDRRRVGVVFQDYLLFPHMSVRDNLNYGLRRRARGSQQFAHVVDLLELGELLGRRPQTLSGGEQQRTALGRAILSGPELLLLDEPLSAVDERLKDRMATLLERTIRACRVPTLFVSHNRDDVRRLADRIVEFHAGKAIESASPDETDETAAITAP